MTSRDFTTEELHTITRAIQGSIDTSDLNEELEQLGSKLPAVFDTTFVPVEIEDAKRLKALGRIKLEGWDEENDEGVEIELVVRRIERGGASLTLTGLDKQDGADA